MRVKATSAEILAMDNEELRVYCRERRIQGIFFFPKSGLLGDIQKQVIKKDTQTDAEIQAMDVKINEGLFAIENNLPTTFRLRLQ